MHNDDIARSFLFFKFFQVTLYEEYNKRRFPSLAV